MWRRETGSDKGKTRGKRIQPNGELEMREHGLTKYIHLLWNVVEVYILKESPDFPVCLECWPVASHDTRVRCLQPFTLQCLSTM